MRLRRRLLRWAKALYCHSGLLAMTRVLLRWCYGPRVTIIYGHRVLPDAIIDNRNDRQSLIGHVSVTQLRQAIATLKKHYVFVTMDEAVEHLRTGTLRRDAIVLTFDDGFFDGYQYILPVLRDFDIPATFYLAAGVIGKAQTLWFNEGIARFWTCDGPRTHIDGVAEAFDTSGPAQKVQSAYRFFTWMKAHHAPEQYGKVLGRIGRDYRFDPMDRAVSWEEARAMAGDRHVQLGSHTVNHYILSLCTPEVARREIGESKRELAEKLAIPIDHFAYPRGHRDDFTEEHVRMLKDAGYKSAVTTWHGVNRIGADLYRLRRVSFTQELCESVPDLLLHAAGLRDKSWWRSLWRRTAAV